MLGVSAGLRSMTPVAIVAWAAQLGWPDLRQTSLGLMAAPDTAWVFTLFACGELVVDKLPSTPSRLAAGPLGVRILMGALCSATACAATHQSIAVGAVVGAIGGVAGAFAGYHARRHLTDEPQVVRSARCRRRGLPRDRDRRIRRLARRRDGNAECVNAEDIDVFRSTFPFLLHFSTQHSSFSIVGPITR